MAVYYNEIDPFAADWLRWLIIDGHIAPGVVDTRSIEDVRPDDLKGFTQHHFFAGIGVWSAALRRAGWPDDRPIWTGSCPCQPFSAAGKGGGFADERHLWPAWDWLIGQCRPDIILGEQVAAKAGLGWFDLVSSDLEGKGYACGAVDLCAAGIGAPHIRQRLWWVAHDDQAGQRLERGARLWGSEVHDADGCGSTGRLAHDARDGRQQWGAGADGQSIGSSQLVDAESEQERLSRRTWQSGSPLGYHHPRLEGRGLSAGEGRDECSPWSPSDFVWCRDGKWRPVESGTFPLAHGAPARVGRLRGYGNAIVLPLAEAFVSEVMNALAGPGFRDSL